MVYKLNFTVTFECMGETNNVLPGVLVQSNVGSCSPQSVEN